MKLNIREEAGEGCGLIATHENGVESGVLARIYCAGNMNGKERLFYARLFQSAEELLEYMESNLVGADYRSNKYHGNDGLKKELISYIKTGDKDDMVTLKMSRQTAESEKLERFIIE